MHIQRTLLGAALGVLLAGTSLGADPTDFGQGTHVGRVTGLPALPGDLHRLYTRFKREANYFAAMAVHFEKGYGYYIQNFHDAGRARAAALEGCRQGAGAEGCVIYAVAMPETLPVDQSTARGLSEVAAQSYNSDYRKYRKPGTYAAFAISGASHHGYGSAYATEADARDSAIAYCNVYVAKDMARLGPRARDFTRARGWQTCKVVDVAYTPAK